MPFNYKAISMVKEALAKRAAESAATLKPTASSATKPQIIPPGYGGDAIGLPTYQKAPEPGIKWLSETERKQKMLEALPTELSKTPFNNLHRQAFLKGVGLPSLGTGKVNYGY